MNKKHMHKLEADYREQLKIWQFKENGWLTTDQQTYNMTWTRLGCSFSIHISINIENKFCLIFYENYDQHQVIELTTTSCNYGGERYWFKCPFCNTRCGVLYLRGSQFACRKCQCLTYVSRNVSGIEKKLGRIKSYQEIDTLKSKIKRRFYKGKPTKALLRYLKAVGRQKLILGSFFNSYDNKLATLRRDQY